MRPACRGPWASAGSAAGSAGSDGLRRLSLAARLAQISPARPVGVPDPFVYHTSRMMLRPLRASDRDEFLRVVRLSREHLARFCPLLRPGESEDQLFQRQLSFSQAAVSTGAAWRWVGFLQSGQMVGAFNLNEVTRSMGGPALSRGGRAEANCWVSADQIGKGLATEGYSVLLAHAFTPASTGLGLSAVYCFIAPANEASIRLAERVGFKAECLVPPVELNLGGHWIIHRTYVCRRSSHMPTPAAAPAKARGHAGPVLRLTGAMERPGARV